ncbi:MAG: HrpE/YscL family type III secretion apparatus protein [Opitutaceae bacterium]|jgi:type III secretion protein L|nr:HrpE/YscL family type III secretion apparatus protein [Opitutaceae bacterium]
MLCLKRVGSEVLAQGPILKATEYAAAVESSAVVAQAREEAARILAEAQAEYAAQKEKGYRDGVEQGKAEMAERVVQTMGQSALYYTRMEEALVDVVIKATQRVIGEFQERDRVERIVRKALELLRQQSQVRIKVSPAQAEWLQGRVESLLATFPRIQFLDVQTDARLPSDGCILETELGVIDATVQTQLRAIEKALIQAIK